MSKVINKFLLTEDKFIYWRQTYSACGIFTKHCGRIKKIKERCNLKHLYGNRLDSLLYSDSKDLKKRTISDKISKDKTYEIARNRKQYISKSTSKYGV